jgi:hypothetical protein
MSTTSPTSVADEAAPTIAKRTFGETQSVETDDEETTVPTPKRPKADEVYDPVAFQSAADELLKRVATEKTYTGLLCTYMVSK